MSGKDDTKQGGGGNEDFKFGKEHADALKLLPDLAKSLSTLQQGFKGLNDTVAALKAGSLDASGKSGKGGKKGKEDDEDEDEDIEALDNKGLLKHISKRVGKIIEPAIKKADDAESVAHLNDLKQQVEKLAGEKKDFWDWKEEMGALVKEHPDLSPRRLYSLARAENPKKAAEMDKKYADDGDGEKPKFGGLMPTSGKNKNVKKMNASEAAEAAWQATMGSFEAPN